MDVSTLRKTVRVTPPQGTIRTPVTAGSVAGADFGRALPQGLGTGPSGGAGVFASLLGGDVIDLVATNFQAGALGAVVPNKILITVDLQVVNKLNSVNLVLPTWPTPPAGSTGVTIFPFEISVTTTSGGVAVAANEVIISSPRGGAVQVSNDWDGTGAPGSGAPHNFFNDALCGPTSNDCFRWEEYGPIPALGSSASRTVGWLIDPTVGDFRTKVILAADLQNAGGAAQFGTVSGTVGSNIGPINGALVSISGGYSGTTGATGGYSVTNVGVGSRTVSVTNVPAGCAVPAPQTVAVTNGGAVTANFTLTCSVAMGTVNGTINNSLGGVISGALVTLTPTGGVAQQFTTGVPGQYSLLVPVGAGTGQITVNSLPSNCTSPTPASYSGLTSGGTVTVNFTVTCTAPPAVGTVTGTITSSLGGAIAGATVSIGGLSASTNGSGAYSIANAPVPSGTVNASAPSCTANSGTYSGLTSGGSQTVNITLTCTAAAATYPFSLTNGGVLTCTVSTTCPTGRYIIITANIDMGSAPGRPDVNGSAADELVAINFTMNGLGSGAGALAYRSRTLPDPNLDLSAVGTGTAGQVTVSVTSSVPATSSGLIALINMRFDVATGSATRTLGLSFTQALANTFAAPIDVLSSLVNPGATSITIP